MSDRKLAPFGGYSIDDRATATADDLRQRRTTGPNGDLVSEEFTVNGTPVSSEEYQAALRRLASQLSR